VPTSQTQPELGIAAGNAACFAIKSIAYCVGATSTRDIKGSKSVLPRSAGVWIARAYLCVEFQTCPSNLTA